MIGCVHWFLGEMQRIPFRLMLLSCVCVCVYVCVCVCVRVHAAFVDLRKRFEIQTSFFLELHGITPDIIFKSLT